MTRMRRNDGDKAIRAGGGQAWFTRALLPWYREHRRDLPWRGSQDPYRVWLSEVILQQTRVDQGRGYWERFVAKWPTVAHLAKASEAEVLKMWQGLGYYSRARNLLAAARQVVNDHGGRFPSTHARLRGLRGVGDYTAAAIASICFNQPTAVVDGNVYRVLSRVFGISTPIDSTAGRKQFQALADDLLDHTHSGDHNQAVMELGALVCTPKNYACERCPLRSKCIAHATSRVDELPVKGNATRTRDRWFNYIHVRTMTGLYMRQRTTKDIWQGLWELPLVESEQRTGRHELLAQLGKGWRVVSESVEVKHVLSHQVIHAVFWEVTPPKGWSAPTDWKVVTNKSLARKAVPRLIERWLKRAG